jgi:polyisoprenoid-binding protein YceI
MKRLSLTLLLVLIAAPAFAETWQIDPNHSSVTFAVRHNTIALIRGEFGKVTGTVDYDGKDITKAVVNATIDVASINTRVTARDNHLRNPDFFDVEKHPTITFISTSIVPDGNGKYKMNGNLTMRGVTRPVTFQLDAPSNGVTLKDGARRMGAAARITVNRLDYGVAFQNPMPNGMGVDVASDVDVNLDTELLIPAPKPPAAQTR